MISRLATEPGLLAIPIYSPIPISPRNATADLISLNNGSGMSCRSHKNINHMDMLLLQGSQPSVRRFFYAILILTFFDMRPHRVFTSFPHR
ncbi:MAG: hypothetical protein ACI8QF_003959 [Limisphaerales bacterium]